ncbi:hypothetical protein MMJ10_06565 [Enterococcus cecorum]|nr:hypothetical protein [Enterococcus cecorum]
MLRQFFEANDEMLDLYTNAITKAHGKNHPEVFDVRKVYETIQHKIRDNNLCLLYTTDDADDGESVNIGGTCLDKNHKISNKVTGPNRGYLVTPT